MERHGITKALVGIGLAFVVAVSPVHAFATEDAVANTASESENATMLAQEEPEPSDPAVSDPVNASADAEGGEAAEQISDAPAIEDAPVATDAAAEAPALSGTAHVQRLGWRGPEASGPGIVLGTTGQSKRMEALTLRLSRGSVSYRVHGQGYAWQGWVSDGAEAGTTGQSRRVEAVGIRLSDDLVAEGWSVVYRAHVQTFGWTGWAADGQTVGSTGFGKRMEALEVRVVRAGEPLPASAAPAWRDATISGSAHVQRLGWVSAGAGQTLTLGTTGRGLRVEALRISRSRGLELSGDVTYRAHVQRVGWQDWARNGETAGTTGRALRVEAVQVDLTGELAERYDVWYRVHAQRVGWMGWARNGESAGTEGLSLRAEAVEVAIVPEGQGAPSAEGQSAAEPFITTSNVSYQVMNGGNWSGWVSNGGTAGGTSAMQAFAAYVSNDSELSIGYSVHNAKAGWSDYSYDGVQAGDGSDIEAIRMSLSGSIAKSMSVYYRTYVKGYGWTMWAKNGAECGTLKMGKTIESVQVRILSYAQSAPSNSGTRLNTTCVTPDMAQPLSDANSAQRRIVQSAHATAWPGPGLCAAWVSNVYKNAGLGQYSGNACDLYDWYCRSSNQRELKVGMIVAVRTHTRTNAGSIWGHVGIYVGDGKVMHSVTGGVKTMDLKDWMDYYGTTYTPKWGWLGNVNVA